MIYFDNAAATYPKPPSVEKEMLRALRECGGNPGRSSHALALAAAEAVEEVREEVASLIGVQNPSHIVFCQNATAALNLAIRTRVRAGMHILISDREHNAVYRPVCRQTKEGAAEFDVFSGDGDVLKNIAALLRKNTKMLICNHVSNVDGKVLPIKEIGEFCKENGIYFIVDASQSLGHRPFSLAETAADAVCAPGQKGLFGPMGIGFAYLKSEAGLSSFLDGGSGSFSLSPEMPSSLPEKMEAGTLPVPAIVGLGAGVRFVKKLTPRAIHEKESALLRRLLSHLDSIKGIRCFSAGEGGILSLLSDRFSPDELTAALDDVGICVRSGLHCAPLAHGAIGTLPTGTVRVSLSALNRESEVDRFADLLWAWHK